MQKARVPAFSQVAEQVVRMGLVFLIADIWMEEGREITVELAVLGHLIGEIASAWFTSVSYTHLCGSSAVYGNFIKRMQYWLCINGSVGGEYRENRERNSGRPDQQEGNSGKQGSGRELPAGR